MAESYIETLAGDLELEDYTDEYRTALESLVSAKAAGREMEPRESPAPDSGVVVDLMEALRQSVEAAKKGRTGGAGGSKDEGEADGPAAKRTGTKATAAKRGGGTATSAKKAAAGTTTTGSKTAAKKSTSTTGSRAKAPAPAKKVGRAPAKKKALSSSAESASTESAPAPRRARKSA